jgi:hypothetical protein
MSKLYFQMTLDDFIKNTRAIHIEKRVPRPHFHNRFTLQITFVMHVNTMSLSPFNPKTDKDVLVCQSFKSESSDGVKEKAYLFIIKSAKELGLFEEGVTPEHITKKVFAQNITF